MNQEDILANFPDLQPEHIRAVLRNAAEREKRLSELTVDSPWPEQFNVRPFAVG